MQDPTLYRQYFENMSEAMATMCDVFAFVMDKNFNQVRMDGIWGRVEFPTLKREEGNQGKVDLVEVLSEDADKVRVFWERDGEGSDGQDGRRIRRKRIIRGAGGGAEECRKCGAKDEWVRNFNDDDADRYEDTTGVEISRNFSGPSF